MSDEHLVAHHGAFVDAHVGANARAAPDDGPAHLRQLVAAAVDLELPICDVVAAMEDGLINGGHGARDVSVLAEWFRA